MAKEVNYGYVDSRWRVDRRQDFAFQDAVMADRVRATATATANRRVKSSRRGIVYADIGYIHNKSLARLKRADETRGFLGREVANLVFGFVCAFSPIDGRLKFNEDFLFVGGKLVTAIRKFSGHKERTRTAYLPKGRLVQANKVSSFFCSS